MRWPVALLALAATPALAHAGEDHALAWSFEPWVVIPLVITAALHLAGRRGLPLRRDGLLFAAGWATLALSVTSPLHAGGERSFTLHMIEHELIMLVASLALVAARPGGVMLRGLPRPLRHGIGAAVRFGPVQAGWRFLTAPLIATLLQGLAMWAWHAPRLFDRALASETWHIAQHLSFLVTALLFWWAMLHGRAGAGVAAVCLFATSLIGGALGALMALSSSPWYAGYAAMGLAPFGLTPAQDQQLAGLIMWIPGGLFHAGAGLIILLRWFSAREARNALA